FLAAHWQKSTARAKHFRAFLEENADWISDYAMFRVLMEEHDNWPTWDRWPADQQNPKRAWTWLLSQPTARREELTDKLLFFAYVQWIAFNQWTDLKTYGTHKKVYLM